MSANNIKKSINANKKYILIGHGICALVDFISTLILLISGAGFNYVIYPLALLINDIVFGVCFFLSNPRFKYTVKEHIIFEAISLLFLILVSVMFFLTQKARVMTTLAFILFLVIRLVVYGATGRVLLLTRNDVDFTNKKQIYLSLALSSLFALGYTVFLISSGFFGQGVLKSIFIYSLKKDGTYEVVDVINGGESETIIPQSFNQKDITSINLKIFTNEKLKEITIIDGTSPVTISNFETNYKGQMVFNKNISVNLSSKNKESLADSINNLHLDGSISEEDSTTLKGLLTLSKEEGSNIINVQIKPEDMNKIEGLSIGQLQVEKGTIFSRNLIDNVHFSYTDPKDCFDNNDKYYLDIVDNKNNTIFGKEINEDKNVTILFVRVYRISLITDSSTITKYISENEIETYYDEFKATYNGANMETRDGAIIRTLDSFKDNIHSANNSTLNIALATDD